MYPNIRILVAGLGDLFPLDSVMKDPKSPLWSYLKEVYYFLYRKFNVTLIRMNTTFSKLEASAGSLVFKDIQSGLGDSFIHGLLPYGLYPNITTGPIINEVKCSIITFPQLEAENEPDITKIITST